MKNIIIYSIIVLTILIVFAIIIFNKGDNSRTIESYKNINGVQERANINSLALPLIDNEEKYIELQTKDWIEKRNNLGYCYGLLEKDKILMAKWMEKFKIAGPKIHYYGYHNDFSLDTLKKIAIENKSKDLIIKITHLQSNYGIIMMPNYNSQNNYKYLEKIYQKCLEKFKTCFVCNHDKNNAPSEKEIKKGLKDSHYKLYETIEPGIIIQDFFYSKEGKKSIPKELKILVYGDKIIGGIPGNPDEEKYEKVIEMARKVSSLLGASLIRVDVFVRESDRPYIPYLNEISLSPNGGFKTKNLSTEDKNKYKQMLKDYKPIDMEINKMIKECPKRTLKIEKYLTDAHWSNWYYEKFWL